MSFKNFLESTDLSPIEVLRNKTWSEWKRIANDEPSVADPDLKEARKALCRVALRTDVDRLDQLMHLASANIAEDSKQYGFSNTEAAAIHYLLWGQTGEKVGVGSYEESFMKWRRNELSNLDLHEIIEWRKGIHHYPTSKLNLPGGARLRLHAAYGLAEIKAAFSLADLQRPGPTGVGVIPIESIKVYLHLVTFRKEERDFAPTTRYKDYLISRTRLHWESQAATTRESATGKNYRHFKERGYTILFFARLEKRCEGETAPFVFLGPATNLVSIEGDRPIACVWDLEQPVPAELFEDARVG